MAHLDATVFVKYQSELAQSESRFSELGIIDLFKDSTQYCDFISPDLIDKIKEFSSERPFTIPTILPQTPTVGTSVGYLHIPNNFSQSAEYAFVMYDVFSGFRHIDSMYANNVIKSEFDMKEKLKNVLYAMGNTTEGILSGILNDNKSQVLNHVNTLNYSSGGGTYTFTGADVLTVDVAAQHETMFVPIAGLMKNNKLPGTYAVVTSPGGVENQIREAVKYGASNDKNVAAIGLLPVEDLHSSDNISTSALFDGYFVRKGDVALFPNHPYDFAQGKTSGTSEWSITDMEVPFLKHQVNVFTREFNTDATAMSASGADTNLKMTWGKEMGIWFRFCVAVRPNSLLTTRPNGILKIQGLTT